MDSYVEEFIGKKIHKLKISFLDPVNFGFEDINDHFTAVCASVTDASTQVDVATLLHYVKTLENGSVMQSYFWMGTNLSHPNALISFCVSRLSRLKFLKGLVLNDNSAKNLMIHCFEEMDHLSKFLPNLYEDLDCNDNQ